jgi:hypothetical protein
MTIENALAANEPTLPDQTDAPDEVEVEYEGQTYSVPAALKDALLRQCDYTRKTQEVAEGRKALESERQAHQHGASLTRAHIQDAARVVALNDQLAHYDRIDWGSLQAQDPERAKLLWQQRAQIRQLRDHAARAWSQKEQDNTSQAQRATAKRVAEVQAELSRLVPEWSPELDAKLAKYGTAEGLSAQEIAQATLHNPVFAKLLHKAHQFDQAAKTKNTQQTFDAAQAARPVTRVGGNGGTASRRTTDSSGDALSTEEWVKRERERLRKR